MTLIYYQDRYATGECPRWFVVKETFQSQIPPELNEWI